MKDPLVVVTAAELRTLVREEIEAAMQKAGAPTTEAPADILNCEQAAKLLGCHPDTVPRLVKTKGLPVYGRMGSHLRFCRPDVLAWLAGRGKGV
jgi:excisionase family DNA binding protein